MADITQDELKQLRRAALDARAAANRHYGPFVKLMSNPLRVLALLDMADRYAQAAMTGEALSYDDRKQLRRAAEDARDAANPRLESFVDLVSHPLRILALLDMAEQAANARAILGAAARHRPKLPPLSQELFECYPAMSAQNHEHQVKEYARAALARAGLAEQTSEQCPDISALVDAVEAEISIGPMDPVHSEDRHQWGGAWQMEPPPEPRDDHLLLQGRRACARRAVQAVLTALTGEPVEANQRDATKTPGQKEDQERRIGRFFVPKPLFDEIKGLMETAQKCSLSDDIVEAFLARNQPLLGSIVGYDEVDASDRSRIWEACDQDDQLPRAS